MVDPNVTMPLIEPVGKTVTNVLNVVKILVGGIFGIYLLSFLYRIYTFKKLSKKMDRIFDEINEMKKRLMKIETKRK